MQPIPGKVVPRRVILLEPLNGYTMNSGQVPEDQVDKLLLRATITVDKGAKSLGVLCPTVADDERLGHIFWGRVRGIRRVHTVSSHRDMYNKNKESWDNSHRARWSIGIALSTMDWLRKCQLPPRTTEQDSDLDRRSILEFTNCTPLCVVGVNVDSSEVHEAETW